MEGPSNVGWANAYQVPQIRVDKASSDAPNVASPRAGAQRQQRRPHRQSPPGPRPSVPRAPEKHPRSVEHQLNLRLRKELPCHVDTEIQIAQPHILRDILTFNDVLALLKEYRKRGKLPENEDVEALCKKVRGDGHPSCIVVLAMLILVDKGSTIREVLHDRVFDDNLPLLYEDSVYPMPYLWDLERQDWRDLKCFDDAGIQTKIDICKWQWYLTVPYMKVDIVGLSFQAYENTFEKNAVLPWSAMSSDGERMKNESTQGWGGYSAVYRYHIDDRFHGFHKVLAKIGLSGAKGFFALKVLNLYTENDKAALQGLANMFRNERQQLNSFNGSVHEHLVTLLAAFEKEDVDKNYFLFPWAECDLSGYWEDPEKVRDAKWVSEQLSGLVGALDKIHNPNHLQGRYGRHGDLKPDNILWYAPYNGDSRGILVISDMGFTAVNSELSRSKQTNGKARTPTYRAPELDVHGANVSREYDVWCLGCIFLEMMMWLLGGDAMIKKFKSERMTLENGTKTPIFFTFNNQDQAVVKPEVIQCMDTIRSHRKSTEFICDVVDVIQDKMIIPSADERSKARDLSRRFNEINETCKRKPAYYTTLHQGPRRVAPLSLPNRSKG